MAWTDDQKKQAIAAYEAGEPTAENSTELVKQIAEDMEQSANGVRQVLVQANVYIKKEAATGTKAGAAKAGDKAPRVSKESQIAELRSLIEGREQEIDDDVLNKLTGKAAAYFVKVFS